MKTISEKTSFIMNLWTINTIISKELDGKLGSVHGISFTEYMLLFHLKNNATKSMRRIDLAKKLELTASGVTRILAPMEKIGLIEKKTNKRDARVSLVKISLAGEKLLENASLSLEETSDFLLERTNETSLQKSLEVFKSINSERVML